MYQQISDALRANPTNAGLYVQLGNYYLNTNLYQALLCYDNAIYYASNPELRDTISEFKKHLSISLPNLSIIVPSYNSLEKMRLCLDSIKSYVPMSTCEIIIIDNGSAADVTDYLKSQSDIKLICNVENLGFSVACNQGIQYANPENDILILHNDTLVTPNAVFWLRMGLYEANDIGATGAVTNTGTNGQYITEHFDTATEYLSYAISHNVPMNWPYECKLQLLDFAIMLKRTALDTVGLFDEQFSPALFEDVDLCYRMIAQDYQLLLCHNAFIYHFWGTSFQDNIDTYHSLLGENGIKFKEKWGFDWRYYASERYDLTELIHHKTEDNFRILEVGCGLGASLGYLCNHYPNVEVFGLELSSEVAALAQHFIPTISQGNIETDNLDYPLESFDYIMFGDVLEHLRDPEQVINNLKKYLKPDGCILASIPNLMHHSVIIDLLKGNFTYRDSGLLDRTHIHFFTYNEILAMFTRCNCQITDCRSIMEPPSYTDEDAVIMDTIMNLSNTAPNKLFSVFQFLVKAKKL